MSFRNRARKGLVSLLTVSAILGGSLGLGGCLTTGRNYNHNASYLSDSNSLQRSHDVNTLTGGILGTPYSRDELGKRTEDEEPVQSSSSQINDIPHADLYCYIRELPDKNHNHIIDFEEMQGLGDRFYKNKQFILSISLDRQILNLGVWFIKVDGQNERVVDAKTLSDCIISPNRMGAGLFYPSLNFPTGSYKIIVGLGNDIYGSKNIEILNPPNVVANRN